FIFFFQAEDGIRDFHVTGVQTCALPIFIEHLSVVGHPSFTEHPSVTVHLSVIAHPNVTVHPSVIEHLSVTKHLSVIEHKSVIVRSEERRVGKEGRDTMSKDEEKK